MEYQDDLNHPVPYSFNLGTVWRRKGTILSVTMICAITGLVYAYTAKPIFDTDARLLVNQSGLPFQENMIEDREFLATQAEIIRSPVTISQALQAAPLSGLPEQKDPVNSAIEALQVTPVLNTDVLRISFRSSDAEETVRFVDAVINTYREQLKTVEDESNTQSVELLAQREAKQRGELEELQREHVTHRSLAPLVGQGRESIHVGGEMLRQLCVQLAEARRRRMSVQNASLALASYRQNSIAAKRRVPGTLVASRTATFVPAPAGKSRPGDGFADGANDVLLSVPKMAVHLLQTVAAPSLDELTSLYAEQREAVLKDKELAQTYGPRHPGRMAVKEQIAALDTMIARWEARAAGMLQQELDLAQRTEKNLVSLYDQEHRKLKDADKYLVREQQLRDSVQRVAAARDRTLEKLGDLELAAQSIDTGRLSVTMRVLQGPQSTLAKIWPRKKPIVLICGVLGLVAAAACVSFSEGRRARQA